MRTHKVLVTTFASLHHSLMWFTKHSKKQIAAHATLFLLEGLTWILCYIQAFCHHLKSSLFDHCSSEIVHVNLISMQHGICITFAIPVTFLCNAAACSHILHIQYPLIHPDINRQQKKKEKNNLQREICSNLWLRSVFCTPPEGFATTQSSAGVKNWLLISKTTPYKKAEDIIDFFKAELYQPETAVEQM